MQNRVFRHLRHVPLALAAVLAVAVCLLAVTRAIADRSSTIMLDTASWKCTAEHTDKREMQRASGGVEYATTVVCDAWGRR